MKNQVSSELIEFIISFCKELNIKNIDIENIYLDTSLDLDLNIFEIDIDVFMNDFVKEFDIDTSNFKWGKQFEYPDGNDVRLLYSFFRSFNYKKKWVKNVCHKLYNPKVFIKDLQMAIERKAFI